MGPEVRPSAVAGRFYPGRSDGLRELVDRLMSTVDVPDGEPLAPAYVVPHAGYRFSGPTAALVYARLRAHADEISRVLLVGPAHHVRLRGCAVSTVDEWRTPLGTVPLDPALRDTLVDGGHAQPDDAPHAPEHSLEVQVPFLQRALRPGTPFVPVVTGPAAADEVADLLAAASGDGTVLICSTDLSHYQPDAVARDQDAATVRAVTERAPDRIGVRDACGVFALRGLTALAARRDWTPTLLGYATSADTLGPPERVVGYAALAVR
ncbi:AmmeMemoRadiSam system protein B [Actinocatenispora rupis]|uniref:MEMO1 family protein n=1 Tax=Actinocatenispora rupis TaxID=519421 RepID=A0A8J3JFL6_9ACTN|nr:AmmeMemoRadiSam system protein B [Actinocatenispora rupis]GID13998.1 MEMO1 family protein [Actinocatenispora rupis]